MATEQNNSSRTPEQEMRVRSRRDFLALGVGGAVAVGGWFWLRSRPEIGQLASPFRKVLNLNETVTGGVLFADGHLAPEFPKSSIGKLKPNGDYGVGDELDVNAWRLHLTPYGATKPSHALVVDDIRKLPKVEYTLEFKCIEGWSVIVNWGGARFSDFVAKYAPGSEKAQYTGMRTPDEEYFVGLDMPSALHPQTILCYEMNGKPLVAEHGAPLRLVTPVKYGIKNIKRIGSIQFADQPPDDYWAKEGYDYYAGL